MTAKKPTRTETDTFGPIEVAADRYWGAQAQRSLGNFKIGWEKQPLPVVRALGIVKRAAAETNMALGKLDPKLGEVIVKEKGGGLFAARFAVEGELKNPSFTVNPLSILTPGPFRRLFENPSADASPDFAGPTAGRGRPAPVEAPSMIAPEHRAPDR